MLIATNQMNISPEAMLPPPLPIGPETSEWYGSNRASNDLKQQWIEEGYSVLRGAYPVEKIKVYNEIVAQVRRDFDTGEDEFGYGDRIGQLHQRHPELLELAATPAILDFLRWALNDDPVVFGSLNFERGTEQEAHIDAIFFWPEPSYSIAGCWVALEDISVEAGPLFYVPQSHKWPFYLSEHVAEFETELAEKRKQLAANGASSEVLQEFASEMGHAWTRRFLAIEKKDAERAPALVSEGR
ncbi:MAG: phytanoyl-CoA dioxygenase family protein [Betaproteobacteria bacterium]|nr:phytanoyl-CoA dioxygenase family protein [Betaproteobacteria bacterium]